MEDEFPSEEMLKSYLKAAANIVAELDRHIENFYLEFDFGKLVAAYCGQYFEDIAYRDPETVQLSVVKHPYSFHAILGKKSNRTDKPVDIVMFTPVIEDEKTGLIPLNWKIAILKPNNVNLVLEDENGKEREYEFNGPCGDNVFIDMAEEQLPSGIYIAKLRRRQKPAQHFPMGRYIEPSLN